MRRETLREVYFNRRMAVLLGLGFASGLPSAYRLLGDTLTAWLASFEVSIETIGLFSLVTFPFTFNFLWAPFLDRFLPPVLTRRRGWLLISQLLLIAAIVGLACAGPTERGQSLQPLAWLAILVAFFAATQDVVADAYRADILPAQQRGAGAAVFVNGYRVAMLVAGGGAMALAQHLPWRGVYLILAALMLVGVLATLLAREPEDAQRRPASLDEAVYLPIRDFFARHGRFAAAILLFVVLFKLPDALANRMVQPMLQYELGFSLEVIALVRELFGLLALIVGAFAGGAVMARMPMIRGLVLLGVLQAASNAGYCLLAAAGANVNLFLVVVMVENFCAGMVTAGFIAFLMSLCERRYSATQFALFTSLSFFTAALVGASSGYIVKAYGYPLFFAITIAAGAPGLALLYFMRHFVAPPRGGG